MRVRIMIQKSETQVVKYKNHKSVWTDYFPCWASAVSSRISEESSNAASTQEDDKLDITVRWCSETAAVNSKEYRILIGEKTYNIKSVNEMGFRHNSRKFQVQLEER